MSIKFLGTTAYNLTVSTSGDSWNTSEATEVFIQPNRIFTNEVGVLARTAPGGVFFSAVIEGDWAVAHNITLDDFDPYYDLHYRWYFDDPGYYTRHDTEDLPWGKYYKVDEELVLVNDGTVPTGSSVTFLGNDKNFATGPHVCHVFDPGHSGSLEPWGESETRRRYTVTLEVWHPQTRTLIKSQTMDVDVDHPDSIFTLTQTACVSNGGVVHGDEPPNRGVFATINAAISALKSAGTINKRICLRRGETHAANDNNDMGSGTEKICWSAYGNSTEPATFSIPDDDWNSVSGGSINSPLRSTLNTWGGDVDRHEFIFTGINVQTPYTPADPYGVTYGPADGLVLRGTSIKTVWDCEFRGCHMGITGFGANIRDAVIGDLYITDMFNYGVFIGKNSARIGFCGAFIKQNPMAVKGPGAVGGNATPTEEPFHTVHTTARLEEHIGPIAINLGDFMSVGGNGAPHQPSIRLAGIVEESSANPSEIVVERFRAEGGNPVGQGANDASGRTSPQHAVRVIHDKLYYSSQQTGAGDSNFGRTGICLRNAIYAYSSNPTYLTGNPDTTDPVNTEGRGRDRFFVTEYDSSGEYLYSDTMWENKIRVYSNTFTNLRDSDDQESANLFPVYVNPIGDRTFTENNLFAFPNGTPNASHNTSFDYYYGGGSNTIYVPGGAIGDDWLVMTPLFTPSSTGFSFIEWYDDDPETAFRTIYGTDPNDAPILTPKVGSLLVGNANTSKRVAVDTFFGVIRGAVASRGAQEPAS